MSLYEEALERLRRLLDQARETDLAEPTAMTLATSSPQGRPSVRVVLLKALDHRGVVFYTNTQSRKGRQLDTNPWAALCLYWQPLASQVLIEGPAARVSDQEADAYWATRPRESQLGAWASAQSELLADRAALETRFEAYRQEFEGREVPRPPHWTGYRVSPRMIEFWHARPGRMHERQRYFLEAGVWRRSWVSP